MLWEVLLVFREEVVDDAKQAFKKAVLPPLLGPSNAILKT
jgi:hypothetical protein